MEGQLQKSLLVTEQQGQLACLFWGLGFRFQGLGYIPTYNPRDWLYAGSRKFQYRAMS